MCNWNWYICLAGITVASSLYICAYVIHLRSLVLARHISVGEKLSMWLQNQFILGMKWEGSFWFQLLYFFSLLLLTSTLPLSFFYKCTLIVTIKHMVTGPFIFAGHTLGGGCPVLTLHLVPAGMNFQHRLLTLYRIAFIQFAQLEEKNKE